MREIGDFSTKEGADKLAETIRSFWFAKGYKVDVEIVKYRTTKNKEHFRLSLPAFPGGFPPEHSRIGRKGRMI